MRLSLEQMRMLEEIGPLAKEVGAKSHWQKMTEKELKEKLGRLHFPIGELLRSLRKGEDHEA